LHIEIARLEHQKGTKVHKELTKLVLQNEFQFLGNLHNVFIVIGVISMLFWCLGMGFVFWHDNSRVAASYPINNGTPYSMIDSVFMTTSAFTNSGLKSAPLLHASLGGKILLIFAMISYAPYVYEVFMLYLYRRRLAQFILQVDDSTAPVHPFVDAIVPAC
jgi:hypothetical protein